MSAAQLVLGILGAFFERPEDIEVYETVAQTNCDGELLVVVSVLCHENDLGKLLGRRGRMAHALRVILGAAGRAHREIILLEFPQVDDPMSKMVAHYNQRHPTDRGADDEAAA